MSDGNIEARAFYRVWSDDVAFFLAINDRQAGKRLIGTGVTFEERHIGEIHPEPTFAMSHDQAQAFMAAMWDAGMRPPQARTSDAQARHLEDMRAITFAKLGVQKP